MSAHRITGSRHALLAVLTIAGLAALVGCQQEPADLTMEATPSISTAESGGHADTTRRADKGGHGANEEALVEAHQTFVEAMKAADAEAVVRLLDREIEPLVFHPEVATRFEGIEDVRSGLGQMFGTTGPMGWTEVHGEVTQVGNAGWLTYHFMAEPEKDGDPVQGRATEVWRHRQNGWRLVHVHWSGLPSDGE